MLYFQINNIKKHNNITNKILAISDSAPYSNDCIEHAVVLMGVGVDGEDGRLEGLEGATGVSGSPDTGEHLPFFSKPTCFFKSETMSFRLGITKNNKQGRL